MATINVGELATTTLRNRRKELADNISTHNVVLKKMEQRGNIEPASGGRDILEPLMYAENQTVAWYSNYETIDTTPGDVIDAATYDWKQLAGTVSMSGLEEIQNSGKEAIINWLSSKIKVLEISMRNQLSVALFNDGTTANQIGGLRFIAAATPTTGTVGGINRATYSFWRNKTQTVVATTTAIQAGMNALWIQLLRGADKPDLIVFDSTYYNKFEATLQQNQRYMDEATAALGFDNLRYKSAAVVYDANCPSGAGFFLNTNYLRLRPHKDRQFVPLDERDSFNQDATVSPIVWAGNLTCNNCSLQGRMKTS